MIQLGSTFLKTALMSKHFELKFLYHIRLLINPIQFRIRQCKLLLYFLTFLVFIEVVEIVKRTRVQLCLPFSNHLFHFIRIILPLFLVSYLFTYLQISVIWVVLGIAIKHKHFVICGLPVVIKIYFACLLINLYLLLIILLPCLSIGIINIYDLINIL